MKIVNKVVTIPYLETEFGEFTLAYVVSVLEELEDTGPYDDMIVVSDNKLFKWLESKDAIRKTIRGECYAGPKRDELYEEIKQLINLAREQ